jgi:hypothetical protein
LRHLGATTVDVADEARIKRLLAQG